MKIVLFAYDFPHKKTQDFLFKLIYEDFKPHVVVATPWTKLSFPDPKIRISPHHRGLIHPKEICQRFNIPYVVSKHNSAQTAELAKEANIGIISGARILGENIINSVKGGIINFHPGIIPQVRGLDTIKWAVYFGDPIGNTAHFIDTEIDAGQIIQKESLPIFKDDNWMDLYLRVQEAQLDMIPIVLDKIKHKTKEDFPKEDLSKGRYNKSMPADTELEANQRLGKYITKFAKT